MSRYLLAVALLAVTTNIGAASPAFDTRIEAKRTDDGIDITAIIANHSRHSACFMAVNQGSFSLHYSDGTTSLGVLNVEPGWRDGMPPPALIQLVPADDKPYRYFWRHISYVPTSKSGSPISVETEVGLINCNAFFADTGAVQRQVFSAMLSAPIEH